MSDVDKIAYRDIHYRYSKSADVEKTEGRSNRRYYYILVAILFANGRNDKFRVCINYMRVSE